KRSQPIIRGVLSVHFRRSPTMLRWFLRRFSPTSRDSAANLGRNNHLGCPRCRRVLIVPSREVFRCPCGLLFRVTSMSEVQLLLRTSQTDNLYAKGTGLPRELVELMPVVTFTERDAARASASLQGLAKGANAEKLGDSGLVPDTGAADRA
ncbi:unnamed protein product, partial [Discosporangium mesarthrocarpum]